MTGAPSLFSRGASNGVRNLELPEIVTGDVLSRRPKRPHALENDSSGHVHATTPDAERPERSSPIHRAVNEIRFSATSTDVNRKRSSGCVVAEEQLGPSNLYDY